MKILVVKTSSLGDIIHALPTVNLLRRHFSFARISWLINDNFADVLDGSPVADEWILFRRKRWGQVRHQTEFLGFLRDLRKRRFDLVVDLQGLLRSGIVTAVTGAKRRVGLSDAREGARYAYNEIVKIPTPHMHAVDRYLLAAQHLDAGREPVQFPLAHSPAAREAVNQLLSGNGVTDNERLIAFNPSARWESKLWGAERFGALAAAAAKEIPHLKIIFIGGVEDRERVQSIVGNLSFPVLNVAGRTSLTQLTELLRRCAALVTNDSGPMHIAAAVGTPVVALFGATDPALTGPYSHGGIHHKVLRAEIPCSPCLKPRCHHMPRMECMSAIKSENVLHELLTVMQQRHPA